MKHSTQKSPTDQYVHSFLTSLAPLATYISLYHIPSVRRSFFLTQNLKQVILEILWDLIIVNDSFSILLILQRAFEHVQGTVIFVVDQVLQIILHWYSQLVPIIILADLELRLLEIIVEKLEIPLLLWPLVSDSFA